MSSGFSVSTKTFFSRSFLRLAFLQGDLHILAFAVPDDAQRDRIGVEFYPSGEQKSYCIVHKKTTEIYYEWYENGRIKLYFDGKRWLYVDKEGYTLRRAGRCAGVSQIFQ